MWKKLVSLNLAILLLFGMLPLNAGAAGQETDPLTRGGFCQLIADAAKVDLTSYQDKESPFLDVQKGDENYAAVLYCYSMNYVAGTSSSTFSPNQSIRRCEAAMVLVRLLHLESVWQEPSTVPEDLDPGYWYYQPCCTALVKGLMSPADDGNFYPNKFITSSDIDRTVLEQLLPKPMRYDGESKIEIGYADDYIELEYSKFTDADGNPVGLDQSWESGFGGLRIGISWDTASLRLYPDEVSYGDTGTFTVTKDNATYFIRIQIVWPELGFYTSEEKTERSFAFAAGRYGLTYNYLLGRELYLLPGKETWECTAVSTSGAAVDDVLTASKYGRGVKLSVSPAVTGIFDTTLQVSFRIGNDTTVEKEIGLHFTGDLSDVNIWSLTSGELIEWPLTIGSQRIRKEDGFSLKLSGIPGKAEWSKNNGGYVSIQVSRKAEFGSRGQLIATKDGMSFTKEIWIELPYTGIYSTKERTPESFLGSNGSAFVDIEKYPDLKTVYLLSEQALEYDRVEFRNTEASPFDVEIPEEKEYVAFTLKDGWISVNAQFEAYNNNDMPIGGGTLTFAQATALRTGNGDLQIVAQAGRYNQSFWGITCADTGEVVDGSFKLGVEGNIGKVTIDDYGKPQANFQPIFSYLGKWR